MIELGKARIFEGAESDVVYLEVFGDELHALNPKLSVLAHTRTHPVYTPHITLAYVKKGTAQKYLGRADLEGSSFVATTLMFSGRDGRRDWLFLRTAPGLM